MPHLRQAKCSLKTNSVCPFARPSTSLASAPSAKPLCASARGGTVRAHSTPLSARPEPVEGRGIVSLPNHSRVLGVDALRAIRQLKQENKKFDIIFLDPPYYKGPVSRHDASGSLTKKTLQTLSDYDILTADGFVITQHFKKDNLPDALGVLTLFRQSQYGDTLLSFYKKQKSV